MIGNDVWIGARATILSGVTIGNGAVVGASAVVTKDIPAYGIAVGSPARVLRKRFDDETIAVLQRMAWWSWPDPVIDGAIPLLLSSDFERLRKYARQNGLWSE